jgi:[ribosomal protein S5]-alanine N-acetyltransferase
MDYERPPLLRWFFLWRTTSPCKSLFLRQMDKMHYPDHLETPRLVTRFVTAADAAIWFEYCNDPVATTYTAIPEKTPAEMAQYVIDLTLKRYAEGRLGLQALISKETGEFIGQCGLLVQEVNGKQEIEVGYHLLRRHWGKGYGTEAAQIFRDYGFEHNFADSIISLIHPQNLPSKRVAVRNGMRLAGTTDFKSTIHPGLSRKHDVFRITRAEWEGLK